MEIHSLMEQLATHQPQTVIETGKPAYIETYKLLKPGQACFLPSCVYIGRASELPPTVAGKGIVNLICINDAHIPEHLAESREINLYLFSNEVDPSDLLNQVADILFEEATVVAKMQRILDAVYCNLGLQHIVDVASEVLENPIFIKDTSMKLLAVTSNARFKDKIFEEEKILGYMHENNVEALRNEKSFKMTQRTDEIVFVQRPDKDERWLLKTVKIHDFVVADISVLENDRPFRKLDYLLLDYFSKFVAIELEKTSFFKDNKDTIYNYFLADLLNGKYKSPKAITQRSQLLKWKTYEWFQIIAIIDHKNLYSDSKLQHIGSQLRQLVSDCRWTVQKKNLVMLVSRPDKQLFSARELERIESFMENNRLSTGFSNPFTNLAEAGKYYRQAQRAVEAGIFVSKSRGSFYYSDMMIYYIAKSIAKHNDLNEFCHPAITTLQKYDAENETQLVETLDKYLFYVNNPIAAAEVLYIHRNTLLYRIRKIKKLTQLDLDNGDERLKVQLYLKFLEYQRGSW